MDYSLRKQINAVLERAHENLEGRIYISIALKPLITVKVLHATLYELGKEPTESHRNREEDLLFRAEREIGKMLLNGSITSLDVQLQAIEAVEGMIAYYSSVDRYSLPPIISYDANEMGSASVREYGSDAYLRKIAYINGAQAVMAELAEGMAREEYLIQL